MMRTKVRVKILVVLILSCVFGRSANAQNRSDRECDDLIGAVKSVLQETVLTERRSGKIVQVERFTSTEEYDPRGRTIGNRNRFTVDDPMSRMLAYPFDESIPRIEKSTYWEKGVPPGWKYGALIYTDVYTYDNKARRSEWVNYGPDGAMGTRSIVIFDEHGRIAETKMYNADNVLAAWNVITRDGHGNVVESAFYKEDGTLVEVQKGGSSYLNRFVYTYEFDSTGNWISGVMSKPVLKGGQPVLEPYTFFHRTITYD
jgi:hypothetical protein